MKRNTSKAQTESHARFILNGSYIFLLVSCEDSRLKYSTGKKISPEAWDSDNHQVKPTYPKATNKHLSTLAETVDNYFDSRAKLNKPVLKLELRKELLTKEGKEDKVVIVKGNFFTGAETIIKMAEAGEIKHGKKKNKRYAPGTIRNWRKTFATLERFDKTLSFESTSLETYSGFIEWAEKQVTGSKEVPKLYSGNYIDALIKDWKSILEIARKQGLHENMIHLHEDFSRIGNKPTKIDLSDNEIELMKCVPLSGLQDKIRDRYIMNLYFGFRISDLEKLTEDMIQDGKITIQHTEKTGSKAVLPVLPEVVEIMAKYNGRFPPKYHRNVVNREIKKIAEKAGITDMIEIRETRGGKEIKGVEAMKRRFELISNHTGRRTAITNYLRMGVPVETLSKAMGVSEKTIREYYDKRNANESADVMTKLYNEKKRSGLRIA